MALKLLKVSGLVLAAAAVPLAVACTAGPTEGGVLGPYTIYEPPTPHQDTPATTYQAPATTYQAPGSGPGVAPAPTGTIPTGCPVCGTYECPSVDEDGGPTVTAITLTQDSNGGCTGDDTTLACDGTLTMDGNVVGSWQQSSSSLTVTEDGVSVVCTAGSAMTP